MRWDDFSRNVQELIGLIPDDDNMGLNVTFEELVNMVLERDW